ncbi:MAG TPA: hypothetical protein GXX28_10650 [Firmicutes bacterium]|nr:hypothetical protein [Bacillota bacterium]
MRPLRVTAHLADGRVASVDGRLALDSMLAYSWMLEHYPDQVSTNYAATDRMIEVDLSDALEKRGEGDDWFWACSLGICDQRREAIEYMHKRIDQQAAERYVDFGKRRGRIVTGGGPYKTWRMPIVVRLTRSITWYCVGDETGIRRLLAPLTHIGKHRASGYGQVAEWAVEPWPEDWSVYGPAGILMRAIPDPAGTEERGIRPPYWSPRNWRLCRVPEVDELGRDMARGV